ncbi:unnamed protein product [Paramecium primaurelia]|uniref:Uncharacterized protein n=1 Tax=Paramecium primaurelia TaxID=5886 RepID=A0A8S1QJ93_PARPR|nr:unnamed protein product [Paramecium primaurelia]
MNLILLYLIKTSLKKLKILEVIHTQTILQRTIFWDKQKQQTCKDSEEYQR